MNNKRPPTQENSKQKPIKQSQTKPEITVAKITVAGTIITAIIGVIGIAITGLLNYRASNLPIEATQTAENRLTSIALNVTSTPKPIAPLTFTSSATLIPTRTPTMSLTPTEESIDWTKIAKIKPLGDCGTVGWILPDTVIVDDLSEKSAQTIAEKIQSGEADFWQWAPSIPNSSNNGIFYILIITNIDDNNWIQIQRVFNVTINVHKEPPQNIRTVSGFAPVCCRCGVGVDRESDTDIVLDTQVNSYSLSPAFREADFYTLQPGEAEFFHINLICKSPGTYITQFDVPFLYRGKAGVMTWHQTIACPESETNWYLLYQGFPEKATLQTDQKYQWNDGKYETAP